MRVLVIDDDAAIRTTLKLRLGQWGHDVYEAAEGITALTLLEEIEVDVVITDLKMPQLPGEELVRRVKQMARGIEILVITGFGTVESAIEVMKAGASDMLLKPLDYEHLRVLLERIGEHLALREENELLKQRLSALTGAAEHRYRLDNLVGKSKPMQTVFNLVHTVAPQECSVVIYGESGTGKELVARAVHHNSPRRDGPLIAVDCGTLSETLLDSELFGHAKGAYTGAHQSKRGRFELADGGTIFLDEIHNASSNVQQKLLRVLQEKTLQRLGGEDTVQVDVRVIAASNRDLKALVRQGEFREDLFYRLNVMPINLPPLRKRRGDIPLLARYFLDRLATQMDREPPELAAEALQQLSQHSWPGNVREFANVMERTLILNADRTIRRFALEENRESLDLEGNLPVALDPPLLDQVEQLERRYLELALRVYRGRVSQVAARSGVNPRTLHRKLRRYELDKAEYRQNRS